MEYQIDYTEKAIKGLIHLRENEPKAYEKARKLITSLKLTQELALENLSN